jgi:integrase
MTELMRLRPEECVQARDGSLTFHVVTKGSTRRREVVFLRNRRHPAHDAVAHLLATQDRINNAKRAGTHVDPDTFFHFITPTGWIAMSYDRIRGALKSAMAECHLNSKKPYDIKKMLITKLADSGKVKPEELAAFVRHKTPQVYQTYYVDRHKGKVCTDVLDAESNDEDEENDEGDVRRDHEDNGENDENDDKG